MVTNVWVDDRDPRVKFSDGWLVGGGPGEFKETVSSSTRVGDSFVVPFYGQSVAVYGTIDSTSGGVVTNYSIDGGPPVQVTSQAGPGDVAHQLFWVSPALNVTKHELNVTMAKINAAEPGEGTIWFDYFSVNDPSGHEGVPPSKKLSTGGIVGVVLGVLVFLAATIICVLLWVRRRRQKREEVQCNLIYDREFSADVVARWKSDERGGGDGDGVVFPSSFINRQGPSRGQIQPFILGYSSTGSSNVKGDSRSPSLGTEVTIPSGSVPSIHAVGPFVYATTADPQTLHDHSSTDSDSAVVAQVTRMQKYHKGPREGSSSLSSSSTVGGHDIPTTPASAIQGDLPEQPIVTVTISEIIPEASTEEEEHSSQSQATPMQHVDSGVRLGRAPALPAELPPVYSPI